MGKQGSFLLAGRLFRCQKEANRKRALLVHIRPLADRNGFFPPPIPIVDSTTLLLSLVPVQRHVTLLVDCAVGILLFPPCVIKDACPASEDNRWSDDSGVADR